MAKHTIRQVLLLAFTAIILYYSGIHLMSLGTIKNLYDGFMVMIFFIALFPFLGNSVSLVVKFFKSILNFRSY